MQQEIWFQKYQILGLLGKGGNAKVYLAEHIKLKSLRAIKFISKNHPLYDLQLKEAFVLKNLKHSCIPIIYDIEENEDGSYIIEQFLEGKTLKSIVSKKGPFREELIIRFGNQLCNLIQYLHSVERPILYIDLKPENIILCENTLKLVDFGSALFMDEATAHPNYYATKGYAAPELYTNKQIDERCDVYGIGCLLYYMATGGSIIHDSKEVNHIDYLGRCTKRLKKVICRCLRYSPSQRYASVTKLSEQLSALKQNEQNKTELSKTVTIAIGGSQSRIGVTHMAFRTCKYLLRGRQLCIYQEKNASGSVWSMRSICNKVDIHKGVYVIEGIPMIPSYQCAKIDPEDYQFIVQDFGCINEDNLAEYLSADIKLFVLGSKEWELKHMEHAFRMMTEYRDINCLFNYLNAKQFQQIVKSLNRDNCFRIPYEPDPFTNITAQKGMEFFQDVLHLN